jgi:hypothetical protein
VLSALLWAFAAWTLTVTIVERSTSEGGRTPFSTSTTWDPSELDHPRARPDVRVDVLVSLVLLALLAAVPFVPSTFFYIGHLNGGEPLVDPGLPTPWIAGYLGLIGLLTVIQIWRLVRPWASRGRLATEVAADVVFGVFLTVLVLTRDHVLHPDIVSAGADDLPATAIRWGIILSIWVIVAWDQVESLRAYRKDAAAAA